MRDFQVSRIPYIAQHCEFRYGRMGFMGSSSGGGGRGSDFYIAIPGADGSGNFNVGGTTSLATPSTNIGGTVTWTKPSGDARISVNSSTGALTSSSVIFLGDSATFVLRADNGTDAVEFTFTAVGTVAASRVLRADGGFVLRADGGKILREA